MLGTGLVWTGPGLGLVWTGPGEGLVWMGPGEGLVGTGAVLGNIGGEGESIAVTLPASPPAPTGFATSSASRWHAMVTQTAPAKVAPTIIHLCTSTSTFVRTRVA